MSTRNEWGSDSSDPGLSALMNERDQLINLA